MKRLLLLLLPLSLSALQTAPWFGPLFQPELRGDFLYQFSPEIDTQVGEVGPSETRETLFGSVMVSPWFNWSTELELAASHTHRNNVTFFDFGRLTGRYLWLNDVEGDPVSLATGVSVTIPSDTSVRNPATFQLDLPSISLHTAVGREIPYCPTWKWHLWAFGALHIPFNGPPHLQGALFAERNIGDCNFIRFLVNSHLGLGSRDLNPATFNGYGPLRTRRVVLGIRYAVRAFFNGNIHIRYDYTPYAKNSRLEVQRLYVGLFYPLSI